MLALGFAVAQVQTWTSMLVLYAAASCTGTSEIRNVNFAKLAVPLCSQIPWRT
jgi:hypothetical protein